MAPALRRAMELWHLTRDAPRVPLRVGPGEIVRVEAGTWPIEPGQSVWASIGVDHADRAATRRIVTGRWLRNSGSNSYWELELGRFERGDRVRYTLFGEDTSGNPVAAAEQEFRVGPKAHLAILWHQHQPMYVDPECPSPVACANQPWVRLHAIRDYYSMAALVAEHPAVRLTINLTPSLLRQIEAYAERRATDRALELTLRPAEELSRAEREEVLATFFDASWQHEIRPHPRYSELFAKRAALADLEAQDLRDLQMWFSLAWFHPMFQRGEVRLATGASVSVRRFVEQGRGFSRADIAAMVEAQYRILAAVIPLHRELQDRGQIELSTSPLYHPILPLLIDTDRASLDRPGSTLPRRFAHPEDAEAQIAGGVAEYRRWFGRAPRGMWPSEGAVSAECVPLFARHGIRWIASDQGVLERSGKWGYLAGDPDVSGQPYRLESDPAPVAIFFRDHGASDLIGFSLREIADPERAAEQLVGQLRERYVRRFSSTDDRVMSIIVDGENPWGGYEAAGRPFLDALYRLLERDSEIETVTFGDYVDAHPPERLIQLHELYTGSWIDEHGSRFGVDLGTWIGESEENQAWELLGAARDAITRAGATPQSHPEAFESLWIAEGSDWFWWFGADQDSGRDFEFDALFRARLRHVWRSLGLEPPRSLYRSIVAPAPRAESELRAEEGRGAMAR